MQKKRTGLVKAKRGRPKGTGVYSAGVVRFAVTEDMADWLKKFQAANDLPSLSDAAREAVKRTMQNER